MDRRRLDDIPDVLTGPLSARPAASLPGRVFIASSILTTTAASGSAFPLQFVDSGTAWIGSPQTIYRSAIPVTITGSLQRSVLANNITVTGTRTKPVLAAGVLATGRAIRIMVGITYTVSGTPNFTWRLKYGTATVVSRSEGPGGSIKAINTFTLIGRNATTAQTGLYQALRNGISTLVTIGTATQNSANAQTLDLTVQGSVNGAATSVTIHYVSADLIL